MHGQKSNFLVILVLLIFFVFLFGGCPTKTKPGNQGSGGSVDQEVLEDQTQLLQEARDSMEAVKP
jgi:hypothetical protein